MTLLSLLFLTLRNVATELPFRIRTLYSGSLCALRAFVAGLLASKASDAFRLAVVTRWEALVAHLAVLVCLLYAHATPFAVPIRSAVFRRAVVAHGTVFVVTSYPSVALRAERVSAFRKRYLSQGYVGEDPHGRTLAPFAVGSVKCGVVLVVDGVVEHAQSRQGLHDALLVEIRKEPEQVQLAAQSGRLLGDLVQRPGDGVDETTERRVDDDCAPATGSQSVPDHRLRLLTAKVKVVEHVEPAELVGTVELLVRLLDVQKQAFHVGTVFPEVFVQSWRPNAKDAVEVQSF